jgi:chromosome segregation ATPase
MTLEKLHEATKAALTDLERRIRELRDQAHIDRAEIGDLCDRLDAFEQRLAAPAADGTD